MSKAKQFLESTGINTAYLKQGDNLISLDNLLTDFAQQEDKATKAKFQEYTELAKDLIKTYHEAIHDIEDYIVHVADKTDEMRFIYGRIKLAQAMIDTMTGVKPNNTPDHTDVTQDVINEVVIGGHTT